MRIHDFDFYQEFYRDRLGITLTQDKAFLLDSRLTPVARKWNYPGLDALTLYLRGMPEPAVVQDVLAAMVDIDTLFMRDEEVFMDVCFKILPWLHKARRAQPIRIWSAGCSTGQEAWSLGMMILESPEEFREGRIGVLGTDISASAIETAKGGVYTQFEIQRNLPAPLMTSYFEADGTTWSVGGTLRGLVEFDVLNLMDDARHRRMGSFDIICLRYVLSDVDDAARAHIMANVLQHLAPDGFLILGHNEAPPASAKLHGVNGLPCVFALEGAHENFMMPETA